MAIRRHSPVGDGTTVAQYKRALNSMDGPNRFRRALADLDDYLSTASGLMDHCVGLATEASEEVAIALVTSAIQHGLGALQLGQNSRNQLLPATAAARAAFDAGLKAAWLLEPDSPSVRTERVRIYFNDNQRFLSKVAIDYRAVGTPDALRLAKLNDAIVESNADWIAQRLPLADSIQALPSSAPSLEKVLAELRLSVLYPWYREASQITHSEPDALRYVAEFGEAGRLAKLGFRSSEIDWGPPILMVLNGVHIPVERLLRITAANRSMSRPLPVAYRRVEAATFSLYREGLWGVGEHAKLPTGALGGAMQLEDLTRMWLGISPSDSEPATSARR
jgi:hypothetical protein